MPNVFRPLVAAVAVLGPVLAGAQAPARSATQDSVPTLIYSVDRTPERPFDTARDVTVITREELERRNPRALPDVLLDHGVFVRQSMYSNARAYLRGFNSKELLVLVDGVQANNAINNFDLDLIDVHSVERIEIVQGVGSVIGSEALGGIINIITRQGPDGADRATLRTRAMSRATSMGNTAAGEISGRNDRFRYRLGGNYTDSRDVQAGGDLGTEQWTGYVDRGASGNVDFYATADRSFSASGRMHQLVDPPRRQRYTSGTYLKWIEPARENAYNLRYSDVTSYRFADQVELTAFGSQLRSATNSIRAATPAIHSANPAQDNRVGVKLEASKIFASNRLLYGADFSTETIHSWANDTNTTTGAVTWKRGQFTDGATFTTKAFYAQDRIDVGLLSATAGVRNADFDTRGKENTTAGQFDITSSNQGFAYSLNLLLRATSSINLIANAVDGFRAPDIEDLSTLTVRSSSYEIPSPNLQPSRVRTYEGGIKYNAHRVTAQLFYQGTRGTKVIQVAQGIYKGLTFLDQNGNGIRDAGEPRIDQRQNIGEIELHGATASLAWAPTTSLHLSGNYQMIRGRDVLKAVYLTRMPPKFGTAQALWTPARATRPWLEVAYQTAAAQHELSPDDVADAFIGPSGTPGWKTVALRGGLEPLSWLRVRAAVENLGDEAYRLHGSQIDRPGREFVLGAEVGF